MSTISTRKHIVRATCCLNLALTLTLRVKKTSMHLCLCICNLE